MCGPEGVTCLNQKKTITFGLSATTTVDTLHVYWPDGQVNVFEQVNADQDVFLVQGEHRLRPLRDDRVPS